MGRFVTEATRKAPALNILAQSTSKLSKEAKHGIGYISAGIITTFILTVLSFFFLDVYHSTFLASESVHTLGIAALIFKLNRDKSCSGLSLRSQQLTALYLGARTLCSWYMEWGIHSIHTIVDTATFILTCIVVYQMSFCSTMSKAHSVKDRKFKTWFLILPCAVLACFVHPSYYGRQSTILLALRVLWAFSSYLEAFSVLPQLLLMQKSLDTVEGNTSNLYVFALGVSRTLQFIHWIDQLITDPKMLFIYAKSEVWVCMLVASELVQTFILADFCYYYIRSVLDKRPFTYRLPTTIM